MMDANDDLCLGDIFYDFDMPETEPDSNVLTPVTFKQDSALSLASSSSIINGSESISDPSDLISSTYNGDHSSSDLGFDSNLSTSLAWHKQDSPDSQFLICDAPMSTTTSSSPSPTYTSMSAPGSAGEIFYYQVHPQNTQAIYYQVIDPMLSNYSVMADDDANMPNVEEVIQPRNEFNEHPGTATLYNEDQTQRKKLEMVSEQKVSSTTVGTEWTYATPNSNEQPKPTEWSKNQLPRTEPADSTSSSTLSQGDISEFSVTTNSSSSGGSEMSSSPNSSNGGATSRKERPLHYCNTCSKGFKDKYSVNVHIRTHTGEKPFACTLCEKTFRQKAHLAKHYQTHAAKANGKARKGSKKKAMAEI